VARVEGQSKSRHFHINKLIFSYDNNLTTRGPSFYRAMRFLSSSFRISFYKTSLSNRPFLGTTSDLLLFPPNYAEQRPSKWLLPAIHKQLFFNYPSILCDGVAHCFIADLSKTRYAPPLRDFSCTITRPITSIISRSITSLDDRLPRQVATTCRGNLSKCFGSFWPQLRTKPRAYFSHRCPDFRLMDKHQIGVAAPS
jgi:hypothetical protein